MKFPFLQLYTGDWLKDPKLSLCSPATRGIWIDLLCAMHEMDRSGSIAGTREQLAQVCRCQTVHLASAVEELASTGTADVTERNNIVTVVCRRMKREHKDRKQNKIRVDRFRGKDSCNGSCNGPPMICDLDSDSSSGSEGGSGGIRKKPDPNALAISVLEFLNSVTHREFRTSESTIALITARLKEVGMDVEGVKVMISRQNAKWKGTDYEEYLRPLTLFGKQKFGGYYDDRTFPVSKSSANGHSATIAETAAKKTDYYVAPGRKLA